MLRGYAARHGALIVFAVALLLRIVYVLQARANPQFDAPLMDAGVHDEWAWQVAQGTWQPSGPFFRAPLYPLFLGLIYAVGGHDYLLARVIQAVVGSASCVLVYLLGGRLFGRPTGLLAGLGAALYWILIFFDNELLIPVLDVFLLLAFFYALVRMLEGHAWPPLESEPAAAERGGPPAPRRPPATATRWGVASGALLGLAAITRPSVLVFVPALAWIFRRALRGGLALRAVLAFAALALMPIAAVTVYNATAGGDFVVIASQGGVNFYIGNNPQSDGRTAIVPGTRSDWLGGRHDTIKIAERELGRPLKESEVSRYWFRRGLAFITAQPMAWLRLTLRKLALFWSAVEIGNNESVYHLRSYAPLMKLPLPGFGWVAPLAGAGIYLALRRRRGAPDTIRARALLPLLFILLYMAGVVAFFVCARFRVPIVPFLLIFAAYALVETRSLWRSADRRPLFAAAAIFLGGLLVVNAQAIGHRENIALARFHDGIAWKQKGDLRAAERALREALEINPHLAEARSNLANLLSQRGALADAEAEYERAVRADPGNAKSLVNLASHYLAQGNLAAAESTIVRALALDADYSPALRVYGVIREQQGDLGAAREAYTRALRFAEERHRLENNLGIVAMKEGDAASAEAHLRRSVALDPTYTLAWSNLGSLLAETGRLPEAAEALERAAQQEPDDEARWLRLAAVLRQLGRTAEALNAERRAAALHR